MALSAPLYQASHFVEPYVSYRAVCDDVGHKIADMKRHMQRDTSGSPISAEGTPIAGQSGKSGLIVGFVRGIALREH